MGYLKIAHSCWWCHIYRSSHTWPVIRLEPCDDHGEVPLGLSSGLNPDDDRGEVSLGLSSGLNPDDDRGEVPLGLSHFTIPARDLNGTL